MIAGRLCRLRPYRQEDVARLASIANDAEVTRWMSRRFPFPYTLADAQGWVRVASVESPVNDFAIVVDGALAGGVGIRPREHEALGVAEFGYWIGRAYWGRGIATEAAQLLVAHAFDERGLRRLEAHVFAPNAASARVLQKCGFVSEGVMRQAVVDRAGNVHDTHFFARLRTDA
jgi:[ribosomal protein S5]-alanine N-acetyltransferase